MAGLCPSCNRAFIWTSNTFRSWGRDEKRRRIPISSIYEAWCSRCEAHYFRETVKSRSTDWEPYCLRPRVELKPTNKSEILNHSMILSLKKEKPKLWKIVNEKISHMQYIFLYDYKALEIEAKGILFKDEIEYENFLLEYSLSDTITLPNKM